MPCAIILACRSGIPLQLLEDRTLTPFKAGWWEVIFYGSSLMFVGVEFPQTRSFKQILLDMFDTLPLERMETGAALVRY